MPTAGNAAANTEDLLDLTGANVSPAPLPDGFQAKGIIALTFSILAGFMGVGVVAWYGMGEMGEISKENGHRHVDKVAGDRGIAVASMATTDVKASRAPAGAGEPDQITTIDK